MSAQGQPQSPSGRQLPQSRGGAADPDEDPGMSASQVGSQHGSQPPATAASKKTAASRGKKKQVQGNELAGLSPEKQQKYVETTPFTEEELKGLLKTYMVYDKSKGRDGIPIPSFLNIPDFNGHPFIARITDLYKKDPRGVIMPEQFLDICSILSSKQDVVEKRTLAFQVLNVHQLGYLQHDEMFRMYKQLFNNAISDDLIVDLVFKLLEREGLETTGKITYQDFEKLVPDSEITARFTVDLQVRR